MVLLCECDEAEDIYALMKHALDIAHGKDEVEKKDEEWGKGKEAEGC